MENSLALQQVRNHLEQLNRDVNYQLDRDVNDQLDKDVNDQLDKDVNDQLDRDVNDQLDKDVNYQLDKDVNDQLDKDVNDQHNKDVNDQHNKDVNCQLDKDVGCQVDKDSNRLTSVISHLNRQYTQVDPSIQTLPEDIVIKSETVCDDIECEWIYTSDTQTDHRILYIHGGSWCNADIQSYRPFAARISKTSGSCVLLVNYRVSPKHPYPAGLADCLASYSRMLVAGPDEKGEATKTFILGDSTGANMALALLFILKERRLLSPSSVLLLSPITDCSSINQNTISHTFNCFPILRECLSTYLSNPTDISLPLVSPVNGNLDGFPDMLIQVSEIETVFDDVLAFVDKAKKSNVKVQLQTWADMPHVFQRFSPFLPQANEAIEELGKFIKKYEKKKIIPFPKKGKKDSKNVATS